MTSRPADPSSDPPPSTAALLGERVDLEALARDAARRFMARVPAYAERYGETAVAWCVHDAQHKINWAVLDVRGYVDLEREIKWLAGVLRARGFPLPWLAESLQIDADVVSDALSPEVGSLVAARLRHVADVVLGLVASDRG